LALTESDPAADERNVYTSGRGKVRAISRLNGEEVWEAKDLGSVPEMLLTRDILYARTGGQFARLENGETVERGPYGVSAIDLEKGKYCGVTKEPTKESPMSSWPTRRRW